MKLSDLPVHYVKRVMTEDEATELVGTEVPDYDPDQHEAGIWADADTHEPFFACFPMEDEVALLRASVLKIKYASTKRQSTGLENLSRTFGMAPRKVFQQRDACKPTALATDQPEEHTVLVAFAEKFGKMFQEFAPDIYKQDADNLDNAGLANEWRMTDDAMWTSGVVNKSSTLPYHRDGFNFQTWSAMPTVRRAMRGGYLHFPEYNFTYSARDGWVCFFPGYKYVHGVTPMTPKEEGGYRYSIVYYALRGMKDCFTFAVETAKGREARTAREEGMVADLKSGTTKIQAK